MIYASIGLTVEEIEAAGVKEVLQAPGAALGSWKFLETLLACGEKFRFREPLGQAREVKVALSGLFGRFVVRAYLERYLGLLHFAHLGRQSLVLDGKLKVRVERRQGANGDLPDWVACAGDQAHLTVAEAKGSHEWNSNKILKRAKDQAGRVEVYGGSTRLHVKRVAVVARWGVLTGGGPSQTKILVDDPTEEGDDVTVELEDAAMLGIVRHHLGNLLGALGHGDLAHALQKETTASTARIPDEAVPRVREMIEAASETGKRLRVTPRGEAIGDAILGGVVTRVGAMVGAPLVPADVDTLVHLNFRPAFVGVSEKAIRAAVDGNARFFREIVNVKEVQLRSPSRGLREEIAGKVVWLG